MALGAGTDLALLIFIILAIGALAGWMAEQMMEGHGYGFWTNAGLGVLGAFIGALFFRLLGIYTFGLFASIVMATVGAVIVLGFAHWLQGRRGG
jgi:uncharacterized membrane protein YeaQ/YmgE (transglycosylase-associated protein family)